MPASAGKAPVIKVVSFEFSPFPGGIGTYALEMARAIARAGASVSVLAPRYDGVPIPDEPFAITRALLHWRMDKAAISTIADFLSAGPPADAILACDVRSALGALDAGSGTPIVTAFHGSEILRATTVEYDRRAYRIIAANAATVANSRYTAELVARVTGRPCAHAHLGVSEFWFEPPDGAFQSPALNTIAADRPMVCLVGRLEPRKGQLVGLEVARALARQIGPTFTLVLAGYPSDSDYAQQVVAAARDLGPLVVNAGFLSPEDLRRLYAHSRCLLLPAQSAPNSVEGFGLVTLEAAAQGCPSIVSRVGGLPEAVDDRVSGFVVGEHDVDAMAGLLARVIRDDALHGALSSAATARARASSWAETLRATPVLGPMFAASR